MKMDVNTLRARVSAAMARRFGAYEDDQTEVAYGGGGTVTALVLPRWWGDVELLDRGGVWVPVDPDFRLLRRAVAVGAVREVLPYLGAERVLYVPA